MLTPAKSGGWNTESALLSDEMNHLQAELLKAIDGEGGGTYELLAPLEFSALGSAITFANEITFSGDVTFSGEVSIADAWTFEADSVVTFAGESGAFEDDGAQLIFGATARILLNARAFMEVRDDAYVSFLAGSQLNLDGLVVVDGEVRFNSGVLNLQGGDANISNASVLTCTATGRIVIASSGGDLTVAGVETVTASGLIDLQSGGRLRADRGQDLVIDDELATLDLVLTPVGIDVDSGSPVWRYSNDGARAGWLQTSTPIVDGAIRFAIPARVGDLIRSYVVRLDGGFGSAHGSISGMTMPTTRVVTVDSDGNVTPVPSSTASDLSGSQPVYDAPHPINSDVFNYTVADERVYLEVIGESGTNSAANKLGLLRASINITRKSVLGTSNREYR